VINELTDIQFDPIPLVLPTSRKVKQRCGCKDNIMTGCERVDLIQLTQDRELVNTIVDPRVPYKAEYM